MAYILGTSPPLCKQSDMVEYFLHPMSHIFCAAARGKGQQDKSINICPPTSAIHRPAARRRNTHRHRHRGTGHQLGEPVALQGCSLTFTTVTVLLASLRNVWVLDHTYTYKKKFSLQCLWRRYHLEMYVASQLESSTICVQFVTPSYVKTSSLVASPVSVQLSRCILIGGLAQMYSSSCSPLILARHLIICNCLDTQT